MRLTDDIKDLIESESIIGTPVDTILKKIKEIYGIEYNRCTITRHRKKTGCQKLLSKDIVDFIIKTGEEDMPTSVTLKLIKEKFGREISKASVTKIRGKAGIKTTVDTEFRKNTDLLRPLYSEYVDGNRILIKVGFPNKWMLKTRWVWEQAYGKIKDGYVVVALDKNPLNTDLSNLRCVPKAVHTRMNSEYGSINNKELRETALLVSELKFNINKAGEKK